MRNLKLTFQYSITVLLLLLSLVSCGGADGNAVPSDPNQLTDPNAAKWDEMVWDKHNWN